MGATVDIATLGIAVQSNDVATANQRLDQLPASAGRAESATNSLSSSFGGLQKYIAAAAAAFSLMKLVEYARDTAMLAARVETLSVVMKVVGANAGYTGSQMDAFTAGLKKMGITTQESMSSLIKMAGANMDLAKSSQLARVAQDAAVIGGINSSEAFGRLIQGIRSGEVEILKTIGINVQFEQGYKKTAAALGKTTQELSNTEKTASRMNEVLAFGTNIAGAYEASMSTAGKQMLSMSRYTEELKLQIGQTFSPALTAAVGALVSTLKFLDKNFESISNAAKTLAGVGLLVFFARLTETIATAVVAENDYMRQVAAGNVVTLGSAEATAQKAAATAAATAQTVATTAALQAEWKAELASAVALKEKLVIEAQSLPVGVSRASNAQRIAIANMEVKATEIMLAEATAANTAAQAANIAATTAATAAQAGATVAGRALTGIQGGLKAALSLVGGELGLIVIAVTAAYYAWDKYAHAQEDAQRKINQFDASSVVGQLALQNKELEKSIKLLTQTAQQKSAESESQFQISMNNRKKEELELTQKLAVVKANSNVLGVRQITNEEKALESKLWLVKRDLEYAPKLYAENQKLLNQQEKARAIKNTSAAPAISDSAAEKAARAAEQWRKIYADFQLEIDKLNPTMDEHAQKIADVNNKYTDLMNKKGADIAKLQALKTEILAAIEVRKQMDEVIAQNKIEMDEYKASQDATAAAEKAHYQSLADIIKQIEGMQPGAGLDALNQQIASFQSIAEQFPEMADKVGIAIARLKESFNESSGLNALLQGNTALETSMIEDPFKRQQELLDQAYNAKKVMLEKELKLEATTADKKAAINKALALNKQKYDKDTGENSAAGYKSQLMAVSNYAGTAAQLFGSMADAQDQSSRDGFEAAKKYSLAAAVMSTAQAIMVALASPGNIYTNMAMAAVAAATGVIQIAKIQASTFGGGDTSVSAPSGTVAGVGTNGGGVAGSAIGARYISVEDSQTTESLQRLADASDNASMAIGKITDGFSKIEDIFAEGGYASLFAGSAYGINAYVPNAADKYNFNKVKNSAVGGSAMWSTGDIGGLTGKIGQYLGGALFGLGNTFKYKGSSMMLGGYSDNVAVADVDEYRRKGGLFGKGKTQYDIKYDKEWSEFLTGIVKTLGTSVQRMAITMGTKANVAGVQLQGAVIQTTGRTAEQISADVQKWLETVAASLAKTVPELEKYAFAGENYYLALTRLNDALVSTNQAFQQIGVTLFESTLKGANYAYKLQELMGGAEAFADKIETYFTGMFTETEQNAAKVAAAQQQVNNAFKEMGVTGITTREQFKALVNSLDLTTEFGAKTFAALMDVAGAFSIVTEEAENAMWALMTTITDTALAAAQALKDIMSGSLSTKSPTEIYNEQRKAFTDALAAGRTAELPELGKTLLEASQRYNASGTAYITDYEMVTKALMELAGLTGEPTIDKVQAQINLLTDIRNALEEQNQAQLEALSGLLGTSSPLYISLKSYLQQAINARETTDEILKAMKIADMEKQITEAQANEKAAEENKKAADANLAGFMNAIPAAIAAGFTAEQLMPLLTKYQNAAQIADQQLKATQDALAALQAQLDALKNVPTMAIGSSYLAQDGLIYAHQGEMVIDRQSSDVLRKYGIPSQGAADNRETVEGLKDLLEESRAQTRVLQAGLSEAVSILKQQARSSETIANTTSLERQAA